MGDKSPRNNSKAKKQKATKKGASAQKQAQTSAVKSKAV
jgi:hypothetical protein